MPISDFEVFCEIQRNMLHFSSASYHTNEWTGYKYSTRALEHLSKKRNLGLYKKIGMKFNSIADLSLYIKSIFIYHPDIKKRTDYSRIITPALAFDNEINQACFIKMKFHFDGIEKDLFNLMTDQYNSSDLSFYETISSVNTLIGLLEKNIRFETICLIETLYPILDHSFEKCTAIERKALSFVYHKAKKFSQVFPISSAKLELINKISVDNAKRIGYNLSVQ